MPGHRVVPTWITAAIDACGSNEFYVGTTKTFAEKDLANGAQSAIRWTKYALNNWLRVNGPLFDTSTALEILGFAGAEVREGLASHLEKRKPVFPQDCPV